MQLDDHRRPDQSGPEGHRDWIKNTLLIFTSDNGPGPHATRLDGRRRTTIAPAPCAAAKPASTKVATACPSSPSGPGKVSRGSTNHCRHQLHRRFCYVWPQPPSEPISHDHLPLRQGLPQLPARAAGKHLERHPRPAMINGSLFHPPRRLETQLKRQPQTARRLPAKSREPANSSSTSSPTTSPNNTTFREDQPEKATQLVDQLQTFIKQRSLK